MAEYSSDTCCDCDIALDDTRVFGMCRPCAEFRSAMRKRSKAERDAVYAAMQKTAVSDV